MGADDFQSPRGGSEDFDGLVGLTPVPLRDDSILLVDALYEQGKIAKRMFSTLLLN